MTPIRTCVGCRRTDAVEQLVRVVRFSDGSLGASRTAPGRGAWLCRSSSVCVELAMKRKAFERSLGGVFSTAQMEMVRQCLLESGPVFGASEDGPL
ncbi:MAG: YlxR family protein [Acidimicrobiales bacterium]